MYRWTNSSITTDSRAYTWSKSTTLSKHWTKKDMTAWLEPITTPPYRRWRCIMQLISHNEMWNILISVVPWSKWIFFVPTVIQFSGCVITCPTKKKKLLTMVVMDTMDLLHISKQTNVSVTSWVVRSLSGSVQREKKKQHAGRHNNPAVRIQMWQWLLVTF